MRLGEAGDILDELVPNVLVLSSLQLVVCVGCGGHGDRGGAQRVRVGGDYCWVVGCDWGRVKWSESCWWIVRAVHILS